MSRLIIWRHGQTAWNTTDRTQGQSDVDLDEVGRDQAAATARRLAAERPDAIVSSDLLRAANTAAALGAATALPVSLDERLREQHFGEWQGMTNAEIEAGYPEAWQRWRRGEAVAGLGIEDHGAFAQRAVAAVTDAVALGETVVVVTHGGTAKLAIGGLLGWPSDASGSLIALMNCHWAELQWHRNRGRWALRSYNIGVVPALRFADERPATANATAIGADAVLGVAAGERHVG